MSKFYSCLKESMDLVSRLHQLPKIDNLRNRSAGASTPGGADMKDTLSLLLAAAAIALLAWAFWRTVGDAGFSMISTAALLALAVDNLRLRRQLRARGAGDATAGPAQP